MFIYYHNRYGKENLELYSPKFLTKCRVCLGFYHMNSHDHACVCQSTLKSFIHITDVGAENRTGLQKQTHKLWRNTIGLSDR